MKNKTLVLEGLYERHPGLTKNLAGAFAEAARVCLDRHHTSPILFTIDRGKTYMAETVWEAPDQRTKAAWANSDDATRDGAYAVAIAAIEFTDGLVVVSRAERLTGADWYVGEPEAKDLENSRRLEVSGVDAGTHTTLRRRLAQKVQQTKDGDSSLPAIAAVVGFASKTVLAADAEAE